MTLSYYDILGKIHNLKDYHNLYFMLNYLFDAATLIKMTTHFENMV